METQTQALFPEIANRRLTAVNEPPYDAAPRIFIGGTKLGPVVRYSAGLGSQLVDRLTEVIEADPGAHLAEIVNLLSRSRSKAVRDQRRQESLEDY